MKRPIHSVRDLGSIVREVRKAQGIRQDELATMIPASHVFVIEVEKGKSSAQIGKVLDLLRELGIRVSVDVPEVGAPTASKKHQSGKRTTGRDG